MPLLSHFFRQKKEINSIGIVLTNCKNADSRSITKKSPYFKKRHDEPAIYDSILNKGQQQKIRESRTARPNNEHYYSSVPNELDSNAIFPEASEATSKVVKKKKPPPVPPKPTKGLQNQPFKSIFIMLNYLSGIKLFIATKALQVHFLLNKVELK